MGKSATAREDHDSPPARRPALTALDRGHSLGNRQIGRYFDL